MTTTRNDRRRHVLVLSSGNTVLEDAYLAAGYTVTVIVPDYSLRRRQEACPAMTFHAIHHWSDGEELRCLEAELSATVDTVATIDEQCIVPAAWIRQRRRLPGMSVADALAHTDKWQMKRRLAKAGIRVADVRLVHHASEVEGAAAEMGGFPVVVKPRSGAGTINTKRIESGPDLQALIVAGFFDTTAEDPHGRFAAGDILTSLNGSAHGFLVEKYIPVAKEFYIDVYRLGNEVLLTCPGSYYKPVLEGLESEAATHRFWTLLPLGDRRARHAADLAVRATHALGSGTGVTHCEVLLEVHEDGRETWWFGEAAARPGGGIYPAYEHMYGFDAIAAIASLAAGERPALDQLEPRYRALTTIGLISPEGDVTSFTPADELCQRPAVVEASLRLTIGSPAPAPLGSVPTAGMIIFEPSELGDAELDAEVAALVESVAIRTTRSLPSPAGAAPTDGTLVGIPR